jgi:hypothetical protein
MAKVTLPRGRRIEVIATVNAALNQQVKIVAPGVEETWQGSGEGKRIGETAIEFPPGGPDVPIEVKLAHSSAEDSWSASHENVIDERANGQIHVIGEDGRGALDANDVVVRFRWVI